MQNLLRLLWIFLLACSATTDSPDTALPNAEIDLWLKGGTIVDGSGEAAFEADVLIRDGQIVYVGETGGQPFKATQTLDARGLIVAPGFIDAHAHADPAKDDCRNFLAQGVTTICLGQDGSSPSVAELKTLLSEDTRSLPLNVAYWVGHGSLRQESGVGHRKNPTAEQILRLQNLLTDALEAGCFGLSTGLEYTPGLYAPAGELQALAQTVGEHQGVIVSHLRNEDDDQLLAAIDELEAQGAYCPVHISHLKSVYGRGPARAEDILRHLDQIRQQGVSLTADLYPYAASYTTIGIVFPDWARPPNDYASVVRSRRAELSTYLRQRVLQRNGPEATLLGTAPYTGKTLADLAREQGRPFEEVLIDIGPAGASAAYFVMDEALQQRLALWPWLMFSSDGSPTMQHPRGYGSFAKLIGEWCLRDSLFSLETAIHKMTALPARTFGFAQRGLIRKGFAADVVVFDPAAVRARATFERPHQLAEGVRWVLVNGQLVWAEQKMSGQRPGQVLKKM